MNVTRGMKRVRTVIIVITIPMVLLGALCTYIGFVTVENAKGALTLPGGPKVYQQYEDGSGRELSTEEARESILYALKSQRRLRNFGILLIGLSVGLWVLCWIIAGFSSERQTNQSLE